MSKMQPKEENMSRVTVQMSKIIITGSRQNVEEDHGSLSGVNTKMAELGLLSYNKKHEDISREGPRNIEQCCSKLKLKLTKGESYAKNNR